MKKIIVAFVMAIVLTLVSATGISAVTIDGVIDTEEWDGAIQIPVASGMGNVFVIAETDYLYVLFDVADSTDARLGQPVGNDQVGLNINPTDAGNWGKPYDLVFQTGADACAFTTPVPNNPCESSGVTDGWETEWVVSGVQFSLPTDVETVTLYGGGRRISEWKVPLSSIGVSPGEEIKVGGSVATDVVGSLSYTYPAGLDWQDSSTFLTISIPVPTKADVLMGSGVSGRGLENAPGLQKPFNPNSKAAENAGKK